MYCLLPTFQFSKIKRILVNCLTLFLSPGYDLIKTKPKEVITGIIVKPLTFAYLPLHLIIDRHRDFPERAHTRQTLSCQYV